MGIRQAEVLKVARRCASSTSGEPTLAKSIKNGRALQQPFGGLDPTGTVAVAAAAPGIAAALVVALARSITVLWFQRFFDDQTGRQADPVRCGHPVQEGVLRSIPKESRACASIRVVPVSWGVSFRCGQHNADAFGQINGRMPLLNHPAVPRIRPGPLRRLFGALGDYRRDRSCRVSEDRDEAQCCGDECKGGGEAEHVRP